MSFTSDPVDSIRRRQRRYKLDQWLLSQRCTLWPGAGYDLTDEDERAQAVVFLEQILDSVGG